MKKLYLFTVICCSVLSVNAQLDFNSLLTAGIDDARRFGNEYFRAGAESALYNISNGWINGGKSKNLGHFEISIMANGTFIRDDRQQFTLNTADYDNLEFQQGGTVQDVANIFGANDPAVGVRVNTGNPLQPEARFNLPDGLGNNGVKLVPTFFIQGAVGLIKGTEVKLRFIPKIETDEVSTQLFGAGIQHELTGWIPGWDLLPVGISGVIGYTNLKANYDLTSSNLIEGENQQVDVNMNSWVFAAVVGTKLPVINFYGSLGYTSGKSTTDLLGTYRVRSGVLSNEEVTDPFSLEHKISGVKATVGTKLTLAFFRINVDYSIQEYDNLSIGLNFGW